MSSRKWSVWTTAFLVSACLQCQAGVSVTEAAVGTAFTYQGRLDDHGVPANGTYDFEFRLYDAATGDMQVGNTVMVAGVTVAQGELTVRLDFGTVFTGSARWLEIGLRPVGGSTFSVLSPRQELTPGPSAQWAEQASDSLLLQGHDASHFLDTSSAIQIKQGRLVVGTASGTGYSYGVEGHGSYGGGYFADTNNSGYAKVGTSNRGIEAFGNDAGGYFKDVDDSGRAYVGYGGYGIEAYGNLGGGYFENANDGGYATVGSYGVAMQGGGHEAGASLVDSDSSGYTYLAYGDSGVQGAGDDFGGAFVDLDNGDWAQVGYSTYKVFGNGTVSFVQNHPEDPSRVVVYHAPEASEVAVYTRGSARLRDGRAVIPLDPTFAWVTNPDLGLTAHLTPRAELVDLAVESVETDELVVVGPPGSGAAFDFMVWGLRIGFEEMAPVQPKDREAYIPSMKDQRELFAKHASLRSFSAFERFSVMARELRGVDKGAALELGQTAALREAIHEFDPAQDQPPSSVAPRPDDLSRRPGSHARSEHAPAQTTTGNTVPGLRHAGG